MSAGKAINEIKQYQDHLGELHDAMSPANW
jgi:CHAD domain-containing protein